MADWLKLVNRGKSTLADGITAAATSLKVKSGDGDRFPSSGNFRVSVEDEILECTARTGDVLTVTRGLEGTAPAPHVWGRSVKLMVTAGVLAQMRTQTLDADGDTGIEVEQSPDEDHVRVKVKGVEALLVHDQGITDLLRQSCTRMYLAADQTVANNTETTVQLDTVDYDDQSEADTANHCFKAKVAGKYLAVFVANWLWSDVLDGKSYALRLTRNGAIVRNIGLSSGAAGAGLSIVGTAIIKLAADDTLGMTVKHWAGQNTRLVGGSSTTYMEVFKVG